MRSRLLVPTLVATFAAAAGCAADATAPDRLAPPERAASARVPEVRGDPRTPGTQRPDDGDSATYTFAIDPTTANVLYMGAHRLELPANAVCALGLSGYGAGAWDAACEPETRRLTITARVTGATSDYPRVDFEPAMRFNPQTSVYLSLFVKHMSTIEPLGWRVLYCASLTRTACIDEAVIDPDLATRTNWPATLLVRRIKHFSGYMVAE